MTVAVAALALAVLLLGLLVVGLLRSHAEILRTLHDAGIVPDSELSSRGDTTPARTFEMRGAAEPGQATGTTGRQGRDVVGVTPSGETVSIAVEGAQHRTLVAFLSSGCLTCQHFWAVFADPAETDLPDDIRLVIVTQAPEAESESAIAELAPRTVPVVMSAEAWDAYDVPVSPYFCLVSPDGVVVGEGAAASWDQVRDLMLRATADQGSSSRRAAPLHPDADEALEAAGIFPGDPRLDHDAPDAPTERP